MRKKRGYQLHLSRGDSVLKDVESRTLKFRKILSVLQDFHPRTQSLDCLDIGCSGGMITSLLGLLFSMAVGLDIDQEAIEFANKHSHLYKWTRWLAPTFYPWIPTYIWVLTKK